jgi:hypothetical protein
MKAGVYNIMKQPISQGVVKSTCVLVNGDKIFKWWWLWVVQVWGEEFMSVVIGRWLVEVNKRYLDLAKMKN